MKRIGYIDGRRIAGFALKGTTALTGINIPITDTATPSSGYMRGIRIGYTNSGTKTGSAEAVALALDLTVEADVPRAMCLSLYTAPIANKTVDGLHAIDVYMDDPGTACNRYYALNLGQAHNNAAAESGFIRMRNHGSTPLDAVFQLEANNPATYLFRMGAGTPYHSSNVSVMDGRLYVYIDGVERYLAVYSS